jgi:penicillin-binding protein 2
LFGTDEKSNIILRKKLRLIFTLVIVGFCLLVLRLGYLQIVCFKYYATRAKDNSIQPIRLIPPRGVLYDRYGKERVVDNQIAYDVCIASGKADESTINSFNMDIHRRELLQRLEVSTNDMLLKLDEKNIDSRIHPLLIKDDVDKSIAAYVAENSSHMQEIILQTRSKRRYDGLAAHVVGYTAYADEKDMKNGYVPNDIMGKAGIEGEYESLLKGELGWRMMEVDTYGHVVRDLKLSAGAEPGKNLILTLDLALQKKAEELLEGKNGAIVALDPRTGDVLVMASKPGFDPNNVKKEWKELNSNSDNPLLNRAIMGEYPPGSTFKIITTISGLEEKKIDENTSYFCGGSFHLGRWTFRCHKLSGHGTMNTHNGLVQSCNVFFYNVAYRNGVDVQIMHKYANMFGLGNKTGIDLPGERPGFIPAVGKYAGDSVNMAIGQGRTLVTPLQMANVISVVANKGFSYKPHVVKEPLNSPPELLVDLRNKVSSWAFDIVRGALKEVVERGASQQANVQGFHSAGKTGTAQNPHGDEHAWFVGFAPFDNPQIAVAIIVENAGRGSMVAAPIAGEIFKEYFYKSRPMMANTLSLVNQ